MDRYTKKRRELGILDERILVPAKRRASLAIVSTMENGAPHVLLEWRPDHPFTGAWSFPGGGIQRGETPDEAMVREAREELGIEIRAAWPLKRFASTNNWTIFPYLVTSYTGSLSMYTDDGHTLGWRPLEPTQRWKWAPNKSIGSQVAMILRQGLERG